MALGSDVPASGVPSDGAEVSFGVLGPWEIRVGDRLLPLPAGRLRAVLASLLLAANQPVPLDTLADQVWAERPPGRANGALHTYVSRLRQLLGPAVIQTSSSGYLLSIREDRIDLNVFRDLLRRATTADSEDTELRLLREALALWRGRPFGDLPSTWLDREVVPLLTEEWFAATERRIDLELATGPAAPLIAELSDLTKRYPTRESLWLRLITVLHRAGRRAEALDRYHQLRTVLRDELGIDPSEQLVRLQRAVLLDGSPAEPPAPDPPTVVRQLPHDIGHFTGRDAELDALDELAGGIRPHAPAIICIDGAPGTGKTTLAVHWAHRIAPSYKDAQLYVNLRGYGPGEPVSPAEAAATLLRGLGVVSDRIPPSLDERSALLRSTLAGRQALIVLDNARAVDQVRPLLPGTGCLVLVTSRNQLRGLSARDGAHRVTLRPLEPDQAVRLLAAAIDPDRIAAEPEAARRLVQLCDRLPLALAIVAERAQRSATLAEVVDALADEKVRLATLGTGGDDPQTDLTAALSWSYRALGPAAAAMFRTVGLHPGADIGSATAAALANLPQGDARAALDQLVAAHLLEQRRPDRYQLHDLIRLYAVNLAEAEDDAAERDAAVRRMLDWYLHAAVSADRMLLPHRRRAFVSPYRPQTPPPAFGSTVDATAWFLSEYENLRSVCGWALEHGHGARAWRIALAMTSFLDGNIPWTDGLEFLELAVRAATGTDDVDGRGYTLNSLGCIYLDQENWARASQYFLRSLECFEQTGNRQSQAMLMGNLSISTARLGDHDAAVGYATRAIEMCEQSGYRRGIALNLDNLGTALSMVGRYQEAIESHLRAHALNAELGELASEAGNQQDLGRAYAALGETRAAIRAFRNSIVIYRSMKNRRWEAGVLTDLGRVLDKAGHDRFASAALRAALVIFVEFDDPRARELEALLGNTVSPAESQV